MENKCLLSNSEEIRANKIHFSLSDIVWQIFAPAIYRYMISVGTIPKGNELSKWISMLDSFWRIGRKKLYRNLHVAKIPMCKSIVELSKYATTNDQTG